MKANNTNSESNPNPDNSKCLALGSAVVLTNGSLTHVDAKTAEWSDPRNRTI